MTMNIAWFQIILLSWLLFEANSVQSHTCTNCGAIKIEYPFGIGEDCYFDKGFEVTCDNSSGIDKAFLTSIKLELLSLGRFSYSARVNVPVTFSNCGNSRSQDQGIVNLSGSPFIFSNRYNRFTAVGCNNYAVMKKDDSIIAGCLSTCPTEQLVGTTSTSGTSSGCNGLGCCETTIPPNLKLFNASILNDGPSFCPANKSNETDDQKCRCAFMAEVNDYERSSIYQEQERGKNARSCDEQVTAVLDWGRYVGSCVEQIGPTRSLINGTSWPFIVLDDRTHICECYNNELFDTGQLCRGDLICLNSPNGNNCSKCPKGYYNMSTNTSTYITCSNYKYYAIVDKKRIKIIIASCTGAAVGLLLLIIGAWWLYKFLKRRKEIKLKEKFFKRNGGLLLQQQTFSNIEGNIEKTKLFTSKELEKATDNYNPNRILGQGGQGTVFKGMLADGRIVAVKKSKIMDESNVEQFINEVVILSQINHRNVVKLLGCCLETDVPLLVYEFIINGTLSQYIHDQYEEFPITWEMRLGIAIEVADALSYMHSAASIPIYHRDIKSSNILLDDKYRAKVSDFGTSRSVAVDQTHLTTQVQGTFGYLDPEYFRSSQFTEKSDVYSFGVVLVELLTGQKPIRSTDSKEDRSLASYFVHAMKENRLFEVLDARVLKEGGKEEITTFASIAKRCLQLNGKKRPTMREAATELMSIRTSNRIGSSILHPAEYQVIEYFDGDITEHFEINSSFTRLFSDCNDTSLLDIEPLVSKT